LGSIGTEQQQAVVELVDEGYLTQVSVSAVSVISDSNGDSVGSNLGSDLSWGLNNRLDDWVVGNSMSSSKRKTSISGIPMGKTGIPMGKTGIRESSNQLSISITLGDEVSSGKSIPISSSVKSQTKTISSTVMSQTKTVSISERSMGDHGSYWGVVDEWSGRGEDFGGSSDDSGVSISRPLAKVVSTIPKTVISDSNRDGMGSNLGGNFSGGLNNTFHNWDMGDSSN